MKNSMTNDTKIYNTWWWFLSLEGKVTKNMFLFLSEDFRNVLHLFICVSVSMRACYGVHGDVRKQLVGLCSLLCLCGFPLSNSGSAASPSPRVSCQPVFHTFVSPFCSM